MALLAEFLADCLEYKQLDIVEFLLEYCKELEKQVLAVCSTHHLQTLYLCGLGVLFRGLSCLVSAFYIHSFSLRLITMLVFW